MLISKKELLEETGISYGQLYRWKRQNLIPEEWFIKKSAYTGQETFFPKEKILNRIKVIQDLKDRYSLDQLAKILSPELSERNFTTDDLYVVEELDKELVHSLVDGLGKNTFSYIELIFMIALTEIKKDLELSNETVTEIMIGVKDYFDDLKTTALVLQIYHLEACDSYYSAIRLEQESLYIDSRFKLKKVIRLNDISSIVKFKYKKSFDISINEE
jgi:DNA-binding transcriptional MerR regulator